jgi:hypothetical protein
VAVTTSAALAVAGAPGRDTITLYNIGAADCYLGTSAAVTTATGFKLAAGNAITMESTSDIYAIGDGATTLCVMQEG